MALFNVLLTPSGDAGVPDCLLSPYQPICICASSQSVTDGFASFSEAEIVFSGALTAGDRVRFSDQLIGVVEWVAVAGAPGVGEVQVGSGASDQGDKLRAALNADYHITTYYNVATAGGATVEITAKFLGSVWSPEFFGVGSSIASTSETTGNDVAVLANFFGLLQIWTVRFPEEAVPPFAPAALSEFIDLHAEVVSQPTIMGPEPGNNKMCWHIAEYLKPLVTTMFPYPDYIEPTYTPGLSRYLFPLEGYLRHVIIRLFEVYGTPPKPGVMQVYEFPLRIVNAAFEPTHQDLRLSEFCGTSGSVGHRFFTDTPNPFCVTSIDVPIFLAAHWETLLPSTTLTIRGDATLVGGGSYIINEDGGRSGDVNLASMWERLREDAEIGTFEVESFEYTMLERGLTGLPGAGVPTGWQTEARNYNVKCRDSSVFVFLNKYGVWDTIETLPVGSEVLSVAHQIIERARVCGISPLARGAFSASVEAKIELTVELFNDYYSPKLTRSLAEWYKQFAMSPVVYWYLGNDEWLPLTPGASASIATWTDGEGYFPEPITFTLARSLAQPTTANP